MTAFTKTVALFLLDQGADCPEDHEFRRDPGEDRVLDHGEDLLLDQNTCRLPGLRKGFRPDQKAFFQIRAETFCLDEKRFLFNQEAY